MIIITSLILGIIGVYWVVDSFSLFRKGIHRFTMPLLLNHKTDQMTDYRQFYNEFLFGLVFIGLAIFIIATSTISPVQKIIFLAVCYFLIDLRGVSTADYR